MYSRNILTGIVIGVFCLLAIASEENEKGKYRKKTTSQRNYYAKNYYDSGLFREALDEYLYALKDTAYDKKERKIAVKRVEELKTRLKSFEKHIGLGDSLFEIKQYWKAKREYLFANEIYPKDEDAFQKLEKVKDKIKRIKFWRVVICSVISLCIIGLIVVLVSKRVDS